MPYSKSYARTEFEQVIKDLKLCSRGASYKKNNYPNPIKQMVFNAAIFQCSSAFEEYIKNIIVDWLQLCFTKNKTILNFPNETIRYSLINDELPHYKNYIANGDEARLINRLNSLRNTPKHFDDTEQLSTIIKISSIIGDKKYPSIKNMKIVFNRFGFKDIFNMMERYGRRDYKKIIKSFLDIRTEIAHQHPAKDLTIQDIKLNLDNISAAINILDRILYRHVLKISGADCWQDKNPTSA